MLRAFLCLFALTAVFAAEPRIGPMPGWKDLKKDFAAVGDGKADDTKALQKALDAVGQPNGDHALWLPAGTYRITATLKRQSAAGMFLIGEDPARTVIRWDGASAEIGDHDPSKAADPIPPATMLWLNARMSRFAGFTLDGAGKAGAGLSFAWHGNQEADKQVPSHRLTFEDVWFRGCSVGFDAGGKLGWLDSEVSLTRCRFEDNRAFGLGIHHFNAVDYWLRDCYFARNKVAVSNEPKPYGGVVHVYDSVFVASTEADLTIKHSGFFALRSNLSVGSNRFIHAKNNGPWGAELTVVGNTVLDPIQADTLRFETLGNIHLMDNTVRSRPEAKGPVVFAGVAVATAPEGERKSRPEIVVDGYWPCGVTAVGNRFTVADPIRVHGSQHQFATTVMAAADIADQAALPVDPAALAVFDLFPVAPGAPIQPAIDAAVKAAAAKPGHLAVVRLLRGVHTIDRTLVIPANAPIVLTGDGYYEWFDGGKGTIVRWAGAADSTALELRGPSRALVRDLLIAGPVIKATAGPAPDAVGLATAIRLTGVDQDGGLVEGRDCDLGAWAGIGLRVTGLNHTRVQMTGLQGQGMAFWKPEWNGSVLADPYAPYPAVRAVGGTAAVLVEGGNTGRFDVRDGGTLVARDAWYESNWAPFHGLLKGSGSLTIDGCLDAFWSKSEVTNAGYLLDGFSGSLTLINPSSHSDQPLTLVRGQGTNHATVVGLGVAGIAKTLPDATTLPGITAQWLNAKIGSGFHSAQVNEATVLAVLATTRALAWSKTPPPAGATHARFARVWTEAARIGLDVTP